MRYFVLCILFVSIGCSVPMTMGSARGVIHDEVNMLAPNGQPVRVSVPVVTANAVGMNAMAQAGEFAVHAGTYKMMSAHAHFYTDVASHPWGMSRYYEPPTKKTADVKEKKDESPPKVAVVDEKEKLRERLLDACLKSKGNTDAGRAECMRRLGITGGSPPGTPESSTTTLPKISAVSEFVNAVNTATTFKQLVDAFDFAAQHATTGDTRVAFKATAESARKFLTLSVSEQEKQFAERKQKVLDRMGAYRQMIKE